MPRNYKRTAGSRTYHDYTDETLQKYLSQMKANKISMKAASRKYSILCETNRNKINGWHSKQHGGHKRLSSSFENTLVGTIDELTEWKFPYQDTTLDVWSRHTLTKWITLTQDSTIIYQVRAKFGILVILKC